MKKWIYILFVVLLGSFSSCMKEELQRIPSEGEGLLRLGISSVDTKLSSSAQTKATETVSLPAKLKIEISNDTEVVYSEEVTVTSSTVEIEDIVLKTGSYTIKASAGSNSLIQETPYFEGSKEVVVEALKTTEVELDVTVQNAWIVPNVDEDLKKHYTSWKVKMSLLNSTITKELTTTGYFVQAGKEVILTFEGTNVLGEEKKTELTTIKTEAAKKYVITCNPDVPQFSMDITAKAEHTKDSEGNLNGTNVTFDVNSFTGSASLVKSWKVEVLYNGTAIRTYESTSVPVAGTTGIAMTALDGWPYVPQGSTLSASLTLKTGEVITPTFSFDLPQPTFGVKLNAYTSYNKYLENDITAANACTAETLYAISGGYTGITQALVDNTNYGTKEFAIVLDGTDVGRFTGDYFGVDSVSLGNKENLSWGSHTLEASMTFDGITATKTVTYYITGLPYKGDYSSTSPDFGDNVNQWKRSSTSGEYWEGRGYILFQYYYDIKYNSYVFSPAFQLPNSVNVIYSTKVAYFTTGLYEKTIMVYTGVSNQITKKIIDEETSVTRETSDNSPEDEDYVEISSNTSMSNNYRVCISHDESKDGNAAHNWLTFKTLNVLYR